MASASERVVPSRSSGAYGIPCATSARISAPCAALRKRPSGPMNLSAFHSIGLWLAVMPMPPAAW